VRLTLVTCDIRTYSAARERSAELHCFASGAGVRGTETMSAGARNTGGGSQTLDRGLRVLETLAEQPDGLPMGQLAARVGIHRTVLYRLLSTLTAHRLVVREGQRRYRLGFGLLDLARPLSRGLGEVAAPVLAAISQELEATAYLTIADGEEVLVLAVVEPRHAAMHMAYRAGARHPLDRGAPGLAILAGRAPRRRERHEVELARRRGYAATRADLQPGAAGVAAPIRLNGSPADAAVGVVALGEIDEARAGERVMRAAEEIAAGLRAGR